jgi:hypothetical protein
MYAFGAGKIGAPHQSINIASDSNFAGNTLTGLPFGCFIDDQNYLARYQGQGTYPHPADVTIFSRALAD